MEKKWIVIGGTIRSRNDGDLHQISPQKLCELYKINPDECYLISSTEPEHSIRARQLPTLPVLHPDFTGEYKLPH